MFDHRYDNPYDNACDRILDRHADRDADSWVQDQSLGPRVVGEHSVADSQILIQRLVDSGGLNVRVLAAQSIIDDHGSADFILLELPPEPEKRRSLFDIERVVHETAGWDASVDEGQKFLLIRLD